MADPKNPRAGGAAVALLTVAGAIVGALRGQPSLGLLGGLALGAAVAVAVWLRDRGG